VSIGQPATGRPAGNPLAGGRDPGYRPTRPSAEPDGSGGGGPRCTPTHRSSPLLVAGATASIP